MPRKAADSALDAILKLLQQGAVDRSEKQAIGTSDAAVQMASILDSLQKTIQEFSQGDLGTPVPEGTFLTDELKELQSRLKHVSWQFTMLAEGDYHQKLSFMGDFAEAFNAMRAALIAQQKDLQDGHDRLMTILNSIDSLVYVCDIESHTMLFTNKQFREVYGLDSEPDGVARCFEVVHPGQKKPCKKCKKSNLFGEGSTSPSQHYRDVLNPHNGRWYYHVERVIDWIDGRKVRIQIASDIHELKLAEQVLASSEIRYKAMFTDNIAVLLLIDPDSGAIIEASSGATEYYGYTLDELQAKKMWDISADGKQKVLKLLRMRKDGSKTVNQAKHVLASGDVRDVEVFTSPIIENKKVLLYSIVQDITKRKTTEAQLQIMATTDSLTGLLNRGAFIESAEKEIERSKRYKRPLTLLMIDADNFKKINDTLGHAAGDKVLKEFASMFESVMRKVDVLGRVGGEEFAALLPETGIQGGLELAERLRESVESHPIKVGRKTIHYTISIGAAVLDKSVKKLDELFKNADISLYVAKRKGRNRVEFF